MGSDLYYLNFKSIVKCLPLSAERAILQRISGGTETKKAANRPPFVFALNFFPGNLPLIMHW